MDHNRVSVEAMYLATRTNIRELESQKVTILRVQVVSFTVLFGATASLLFSENGIDLSFLLLLYQIGTSVLSLSFALQWASTGVLIARLSKFSIFLCERMDGDAAAMVWEHWLANRSDVRGFSLESELIIFLVPIPISVCFWLFVYAGSVALPIWTALTGAGILITHLVIPIAFLLRVSKAYK